MDVTTLSLYLWQSMMKVLKSNLATLPIGSHCEIRSKKIKSVDQQEKKKIEKRKRDLSLASICVQMRSLTWMSRTGALSPPRKLSMIHITFLYFFAFVNPPPCSRSGWMSSKSCHHLRHSVRNDKPRLLPIGCQREREKECSRFKRMA